MKIIVGLGNPEDQYTGTRHNIGFDVIDRLAAEHGITVNSKKHKALVGSGVIGGQKCLLVKPQTYMNLSGDSVIEVVNFYKCDPAEDVIIIHDDISLPVGQLRLRAKGSAGGHNGLKSIIAHIGDAFYRIKFGVGEKPERMDLAAYVLGRFPESEWPAVKEGVTDAAKAVEMILSQDFSAAQNVYNKKKE
jgi:PTH1 family peptidyl-tRNA hydrolase